MKYMDIVNVDKNFNSNNEEHKVLMSINFSIEKGDFICIVGSSGCGKTTLLRIMAGFEKPTNGKIFCNGEKIKKPRMKGAFIFQEHDQLLPWKTAINNVTYPLMLKSMTKKDRERKAEEYFNLVGLDFANDSKKYSHHLSGGMKQRVAIARSLAMQPEILFMDEPFSSVDAYIRDILNEKLLSIWKELELTIVFVTHSIDEAIRLSTKIIVLGGKPAGIVGNYTNSVKGQRRPTDDGYSKLWDSLYSSIRD